MQEKDAYHEGFRKMCTTKLAHERANEGVGVGLKCDLG